MALTTRLTLIQRIAPMLGGYQGSITSGTATTAVLDGIVGAMNDDELNDWLLIMPDAATAADTVRIVSDHTGTTGTVTFATRADTTYTSETYCLIPKNSWTLQEIRQQISAVLRKTRRTRRYVVPTRDDAYSYQLPELSWLRNKADVDGVLFRESPNLIDNAAFDYWDAGTAVAPDGWVLAGSGGTVAQASTYASFGSYTADVTRVGADTTLTYTLPYALAKQLIDDRATVAIKVRCRATVAARGRVGINDGTGTLYSSYHTGGSTQEDLTKSFTLTSASTTVQLVLSVDTGNTTVSFDFAPMVEDGSVQDTLMNAGDAGYLEHDVADIIQNIGSAVPALVLGFQRSRKDGQFVVVTRRPFADLTTDAASTECPSDVLEAGTIYWLAAMHKPGMDQARMKELREQWGPTYTSLANGLIDKPVSRTLEQTLVRGA